MKKYLIVLLLCYVYALYAQEISADLFYVYGANKYRKIEVNNFTIIQNKDIYSKILNDSLKFEYDNLERKIYLNYGKNLVFQIVGDGSVNFSINDTIYNSSLNLNELIKKGTRNTNDNWEIIQIKIDTIGMIYIMFYENRLQQINYNNFKLKYTFKLKYFTKSYVNFELNRDNGVKLQFDNAIDDRLFRNVKVTSIYLSDLNGNFFLFRTGGGSSSNRFLYSEKSRYFFNYKLDKVNLFKSEIDEFHLKNP